MKATQAIYQLHNSLDPLTIGITLRVLKLQSLNKPREHFEKDFLNDIGIINLLRGEYIKSGSLKRTFYLYQDTRREPGSHRYESLIATLVITIVGAIVSGIIVEEYKINRDKIMQFFTSLLRSFGAHAKTAASSALDFITRNGTPNRLIEKYCDSSATQLQRDFEILLKCFEKRQQLLAGLITNQHYQEEILQLFERVGSTATPGQASCSGDDNYQSISCTNKICVDTVMLAIKYYSIGTTLIHFEVNNIEPPVVLPAPSKTHEMMRGLGVSAGVHKGTTLILRLHHRLPTNHHVLVATDADMGENRADFLTKCRGVITKDTGFTGHIPLICRGLKIPCVILGAADYDSIENGIDVVICGSTGNIITGSLARSVEFSPLFLNYPS